MNIGFIGLGIMGKPMAENLLRNNYKVTVFDINENAVSHLVQKKASAAQSPQQVAEKSDVIFTMLPNSEHVESVVLGENGLVHGGKKDTIVVDLSSISPIMSRKISAELASKGMHMLDAPVSGGELKAIDGTLSIMVGGDEAIFNKVKPILLCMGQNIILVGEIGSGTTTKLANQIIVNVNIAAISEAITLAKNAGIDIQKMYDAIRGGLAGSAVLDAKLPLILERNFKAGGSININAKDLTNVLAAGEIIETPLPLTNKVLSMFKELIDDGKASDDHGGLIQYYEKHSELMKEEVETHES